MAEQKKLGKIKSSVFSRGLSLAKLTLGGSVQLAGHGLERIFANDAKKQESWKKFLSSQALGLSGELGDLKGSLMKAGQMLSMYGEYFLPPEANQFLKSLQSNSAPVEWTFMESVLKKRLSAKQLSQLEIDPRPIGTASLGQVHKAKVIKTGEWIALKIQYPGVDKAIESDLKMLKTFLKFMDILPKDFNSEPMFKEVSLMLHQEVDYAQEMKATEDYARRLKGDSRFVIPRVIKEFCGEKVIATSFESGVSTDDPSVLNLSATRRNKLASHFLDLYFTELCEWGLFQTDPHLGNYKIRINPNGEDQIVLLDFGATRQYDEEFLKAYREMIRSASLGNRKKIRSTSLTLKFLHKDDPEDLKVLFEDFVIASVEPFQTPDQVEPQYKKFFNEQGYYKWKETDLPTRLTKMVFQIIQNYKVRSPPSEVIFLDRKSGGVFIYLATLRAEINSKAIFEKHLLQEK